MGFIFERAALVGVGMVGGSLGRAMLGRGLVKDVVGIDPTGADKALELGAVTETAATLKEGVAHADLVVLAAPVMAVLELLPQLASLLKAGAVVTDVSSTKAMVMDKAAEVLPESVTFVGGHPMAGSEKDGVEALDENLFENAVYVLTYGAGDSQGDRVATLVEKLGAVPVKMDAGQHDRVVASVSHLPHMAASALAETVAANDEDRERIMTLAASGFRDTTRVAMGSPQMWRDICLTNHEHITDLMDTYIKELAEVRDLVASGDGTGLLEHFERARDFRRQVPGRGKGILPTVYNLFVYVPDKTGVIGEVAGLLGDAGINIAEIELLRVREEEGGPLRLGFITEDSLRLAEGVLKKHGYRTELQEG
ncbi:prephenate dehydrogenase [Dethiobacter alkaliphilus]|uniref:prephenate dehydrogenase n=1 Tax=Dethiobacter alkaliphilus TaxID=427926 RepID=UPI0022275DA6|nr:prephenate dehydrogenase [Dethiobacter alkaliphilus]MCW3491299.1 prephenate dehydrogenase [Dethiobacter alkaliphilus]